MSPVASLSDIAKSAATKQSSYPHVTLDCFAALAMTEDGELRRQLHEGQRLGEAQVDRPPQLGPERLSVEDHVRVFAVDSDLVGFLEMNAAQWRVPKLAGDARG